MVDWLRSKTPSVAVEVNSDEEATKLLQENKVFNLILTIVIQRLGRQAIVIVGQFIASKK